MSDTQNVTLPNNSTSSLWSAAGGGLVGALLGNNGVLGGGGAGSGGISNGVSFEQLNSALNSLQGQMNTDTIQGELGRIQEQMCQSTAATNGNISHNASSIKDAINSASSMNQLTLCQLGHKIESGLAAVNQNIITQGYESRLLSTQQQLDAARALATEQRILLTEFKNQTGHNQTQVQIQALVGALGK